MTNFIRNGIPVGGTTGQILSKTSNEDYDAQWIDEKKGVTFTPSVNADGVISWTNDGGLDNPEPVSIKGNAGAVVTAEGQYGFQIDENGNLILTYTGEVAPDFYIADDGTLRFRTV